MQLKSESSSVGRARPCQGRGRGFESRLPLINEIKSRDVNVLINELDAYN
jgi:hypothetical protein